MMPGNNAKKQEERRQRMRRLYESGMTLRAVAEKMGCSFQSVHQVLRLMGVPMRTRGGNMGSHSRRRR